MRLFSRCVHDSAHVHVQRMNAVHMHMLTSCPAWMVDFWQYVPGNNLCLVIISRSPKAVADCVDKYSPCQSMQDTAWSVTAGVTLGIKI